MEINKPIADILVTFKHALDIQYTPPSILIKDISQRPAHLLLMIISWRSDWYFLRVNNKK